MSEAPEQLERNALQIHCTPRGRGRTAPPSLCLAGHERKTAMIGLQELASRLRQSESEDHFVELLRTAEVDFLDLRFTDIAGRWHHVTLPTTRLNAVRLVRGVGFDGSSVPGFGAVESGDMVLIPDRATATVEEHADHLAVAMIASAADADTQAPFRLDPRVIASRAENVLEDSGHADLSLWSPELEFYLFTGVTYGSASDGSYYFVQSEETGWLPEDDLEPQLGYRIRSRSGYHAIPPSDAYYQVRNEIAAAMEETGIPIKYHHHENGAPGQSEIELEPATLRLAADSIMMGKYIVRNTAADWDLASTFMPKPLAEEPGSGLHFHIKLIKDGRPVFHREGGYAGLSEEALFFIGGVLRHGRALAAITNPSTNSYRRLRPGYEAPTNLFFSAANRSAAIRIPKYANSPETKTIEFRPSDASCNPYLAVSAILAAGLEGMTNRIDPRESGFGPFDTNIHELPDAERDRISPLPSTLEEALEALADDGDFLSGSGIFPEEFVQVWLDMKRADCKEVGARPHPAEYDLYFDC